MLPLCPPAPQRAAAVAPGRRELSENWEALSLSGVCPVDATVGRGTWERANRRQVCSQLGRSTWGQVPCFSQRVPCPNQSLHHPHFPFHGCVCSLQRANTQQAVRASAGTPALTSNHPVPAKEGGMGALCHLPTVST